MAVGDLDPPGVADRTKDLGPVLVARWLVPPNAANFVTELHRQSCGGGLRRAAVHEHEPHSLVRPRAGKVVEYLFDGARLGRRSGDDAHAERQARDVHADNALGPVGPAVGATLVVEGDTSVRGPSCEMSVDDDHRRQRVLSAEGGARRRVQGGENPRPRSVP